MNMDATIFLIIKMKKLSLQKLSILHRWFSKLEVGQSEFKFEPFGSSAYALRS